MGAQIAGTCGACRNVRGRPLFVYLKSVRNCAGSKIEHLLSGGLIKRDMMRADYFKAVMLRILRDKPMPAREFKYMALMVINEYGVTDSELERRGMRGFRYLPSIAIGSVCAVDGEIIFHENRSIADMRDEEFKRPKYKKMDAVQVDFLASLFELSEYSKQLFKDKKCHSQLIK